MRRLLEDPKLFSYVILVLYACNSTRWLFARNWGQSLYWFAALLITTSVTFLMGAK
jgi:hypothetical protein